MIHFIPTQIQLQCRNHKLIKSRFIERVSDHTLVTAESTQFELKHTQFAVLDTFKKKKKNNKNSDKFKFEKSLIKCKFQKLKRIKRMVINNCLTPNLVQSLFSLC